MRYLGTILAMLALGALPLAGRGGGKSDNSKLVDALAAAPSLVVYSEDGAADATVTQNPAPEVRAIVGLGSRALPLLCPSASDKACRCRSGVLLVR